MKRYDIDAPAKDQYTESPDGEWVRWKDVEALLSGARGLACPRCSRALTLCAEHGLYVRTDENQCPACRRGE